MGKFEELEVDPAELVLDSKRASPQQSPSKRVTRSQRLKKFKRLIRPGFFLDHLDFPSFKIASRTFIQFFISITLNSITPVNNWFGGSAYLLNVANIWDPPGGFSVVGGICLATVDFFQVGVSVIFFLVIDAINWRLHGYKSIEEVYVELEGVCNWGDDNCVREQLLDGRYLSIPTITVAIFGIILCLTWHYYFSSSRPYLRCAWLFGMVSALILIPESVHCPYWDPWHKTKSILRCLGCATAMKATLSILYFPITSSCKIVNFLDKTLGNLTNASLETFQYESLAPSDPEFKEKFSTCAPKIERFLQKGSVLELDFLLCKYELAYTRFKWEDLHELRKLISSVGNILYNFHFVYAEFADRSSNTTATAGVYKSDGRPQLKRGMSTNPDFDYGKRETKWKSLQKKYLQSGNFEQIRHMEYLKTELELRPLSQNDLNKLFHEIVAHYAPLNTANTQLLAALQVWMKAANSFRWNFLCGATKRHQKKQRELNERLQLAVRAVVQVYEKLSLDDDWIVQRLPENLPKGTKTYIVGQALYYGFISKEYARHVRNVAKWCLMMDDHQPSAQWTWYSRSDKRHFVYGTTPETRVDGLDLEQDSVPYQPLKSQVRDPDSTPPRNFVHVAASKSLKFFNTYFEPRLLYSFKVGCTAIIPLIPFFVRPTLHWVHSNRGIWAAITCMMSASPKASDSVFGLLSRIFATCCGGVIGICSWYIAAGPDGQGNPYGLVAILSFVGIGLVYFRHFNTVGGTIMSIVLMLTVILVTMGSYSTKHNEEVMYTLKQSGAILAADRLVALLIGIIVAFISTIFPSFATTKKAVRISLSGVLFKLGELQADLLNFSYQRQDNPKVSLQAFKDVITLKLRTGFGTLRATRQQLQMLKFEPPLTGIWPKYEYNLFVQLEEELMMLTSLYYTLLARLKDTERTSQLLHVVGWSNNGLLSSVSSSYFMAAHAIKKGEPLPPITTGNICESYQKHALNVLENWQIEALCSTADGRLLLTAMVLSENYYQRLDGVLMIVKTLVGEFSAMDSRMWQDMV